MTEQTPKCAFCGKHKDEVKHLIEGDDGAFICNECVSECAALLHDISPDQAGEKTIQKPESDNTPLPTPAELVAQLNEHVIGQDMAKKALAVAVYNHYKRLRQPEK